MLYRLGFGVLGCAAVVGAVLVGCSSDDATNNNTTSDAGTTADSGTTNPDGGTATTGAPITEAVQDKWTWIPFPDSACGNGSTTGIGVNLGTSKRLVIYLEGGGACWDANTCYSLGTASNLSGFGPTEFSAVTAQQTGSALDRSVADNPFKDDNFVYIPYCTGDVHAGNKVQTYTGAPSGESTHHVGRANVDAFLKRIVPTFADATRVELSGSSAGGFGAAINYERVRTAFGGTTRVDLIDDSGPPFPNADIATYPLWAASWDLGGAYPTACATCGTDITTLVPYYAAKYKDAKFALLSYDQDQTIRQFFQTPTPAAFKTQLEGVITAQFDATTNAKAFEVHGNLHTMYGTGDKIDAVSSNGVTVAQWITQMSSDDAAWATQKATAAH